MAGNRNPVTELREALGMDRRAFGLFVGCSYGRVYDAECGFAARIPRRMEQGLRAAGLDAEGLAARYTAWREAQQERLREQVV